MNGVLKNKLVMCVLVLIVISVGYIFADDVTVQEGTISVDNIVDAYCIGYSSYPYAYLSDTYIDGDFTVSGSIGSTYDDTVIGGDLYVYGSIVIDDEVEIYSPYSEVCYFNAPEEIQFTETLFVFGPESTVPSLVGVDGDFWATGDIYADGKVESTGGYDPPYVLYDQQSREEVIDRIKKEVKPEKQNGAAMFFNKETKRLETYVASEGKFYDLEGNVIYELAEIVEPTTKYETVYHFDSKTGQARPILRPVQEKFQIKNGYALDDKTGNFINKTSGQAASREEALEIYVASEGKVYDLQHNFVRNIERGNKTDILATGHNTDSTNQVTTAQNDVEQEMTIAPASLSN